MAVAARVTGNRVTVTFFVTVWTWPLMFLCLWVRMCRMMFVSLCVRVCRMIFVCLCVRVCRMKLTVRTLTCRDQRKRWKNDRQRPNCPSKVSSDFFAIFIFAILCSTKLTKCTFSCTGLGIVLFFENSIDFWMHDICNWLMSLMLDLCCLSNGKDIGFVKFLLRNQQTFALGRPVAQFPKLPKFS